MIPTLKRNQSHIRSSLKRLIPETKPVWSNDKILELYSGMDIPPYIQDLLTPDVNIKPSEDPIKKDIFDDDKYYHLASLRNILVAPIPSFETSNNKTPLTLTPEQKQIIENSKKLRPHEKMTIDAIAGSGKTYTLIQVASANPNKSIFYTAFNKAIVEESRKRLSNNKNVECRTIHSLAYNSLGMTKDRICPEYTWFTSPREITKGVSLNAFAVFKKLYTKFINSDMNFDEFEDRCLRSNYHEMYPEVKAEVFFTFPEKIRLLFELAETGRIRYSHGMYLKKFQLDLKKKGGLPKKDRYDIVMLDEAQDVNSVMLDILLHVGKSIILVGDSHQNIYGFIDTINALQTVKNVKYKETLKVSFRCPQEYLNRSMECFEAVRGEKDLKFVSKNDLVKDTHKRALITRLNSTLLNALKALYLHIEHCVDGIENQKNFRKRVVTIKDLNSLFGLSDAIYCHLLEENDDSLKIRDEFKYVTKFKDLNDAYYHARVLEDVELYQALEFCNTTDFELYKNLKRLAAKIYHPTGESGQLILCNAHIVKGLEFDSTVIYNDFPMIVGDPFTSETDEEKSVLDPKVEYAKVQKEILESNLYYVALTRAKFSVEDLTFNYENLKRIKDHQKRFGQNFMVELIKGDNDEN